MPLGGSSPNYKHSTISTVMTEIIKVLYNGTYKKLKVNSIQILIWNILQHISFMYLLFTVTSHLRQ